MGRTFTLTTALYVFAMLGCTFAFYVQRYVVINQHIRPGQETAGQPIAVEIVEKGTTTVQQSTLRLLDQGAITRPLRMGSELQEQLQAVLFANLATGVYLIVMNARKVPRS